MSIVQSIEDFHQAIITANKSLQQSRSVIESRQEEIGQVIQTLKKQVTLEYGQEENRSAIKQLALKQINEYKKTVDQWIMEVNKYVQGKEFVNQFEKSVLLMVFGDVKAGKSALGNFISEVSFKGTPYEKYSTPTSFYVYDSASKQKNELGEKKLDTEGFVVDAIEATSTIQYFTLLNGLTWVDTPGIHSLTTENQELANEYIKYADLILFLTPSNNPAKQDECQEIERLLQLEKPLLITITKSDNEEFGFVNGELGTILTAKTPENRKQQESYLASVINEMGGKSLLSRNKYISLSTKLACHALAKDDEKMFKESNLSAFYEQISEIISEKALELKMQRPKGELNMVIHDLVEGVEERDIYGIKQLKANVLGVLSEIDKNKQLLQQVKLDIAENAKTELMTDIYEIMYKAKQDGSITNSDYISNQLSNVIQECVGKHISKKMGEILSDFRNHTMKAHTIHTNIRYEKSYENIEYPLYEIKTVRRDPKGLVEHLQSWVFNKEFTETRVKNTMVSKKIETGDNYNEVFQEVWGSLENQIHEMVDVEVSHVTDVYFNEMQTVFKEILSTLDQVQNKIEVLRF